ncbi:DsbA family oxidoreductase [Geomicrobium sediminis]|uniref:DsbA family dithiol-disulfide isomerase n=1 Tax=Geomicrobium sediminis TaxID=1347788 RepID=A0ABS2PB83_9BACL|nr:DsbA family oxidoreductase [Geomicrobium sediminis]MBM7632113.1 putative DsbA family dithiol-disulfide isomerase [Geomicrobium sediminis]
MNIEVWSDIACPFCYIGKRKFEMGLDQFSDKENVKVTYKSFQLQPDADVHTTETLNEQLEKKFGQGPEQVAAMQQQVVQQANDVNLDYHMDDVKPTNTESAHRLIHYAKEHGKMAEMKEELLKAYFIEGKHVGEHEQLAALAERVGLNKQTALTILESGAYKEAVQQDIQEGAQLGVQGVPFFVFNRKYAVSGAQPPEAFLEVLNKVRDEEKDQGLKVMNQGDACTDESC